MTAIDDLQRVVMERPAWDDAGDFAAAVVPQYRRDWWQNGDTRVEVWAEKLAVASIVEPEALRFGVPFMACRGYASLTALAEAADRWDRRTVLLYVGDLDPSGADMDRDIEERLRELSYTSVEVRAAGPHTRASDRAQFTAQPYEADGLAGAVLGAWPRQLGA